MRCEDVQRYMALNVPDPTAQTGVQAHLATCPACKSAGLLYAKIDEVLTAQPVWDPPQHFVRRLVSQLPAAALVSPVLSRREILQGVALGLSTIAIVGVAGYAVAQWGMTLSDVLNANRVGIAWASAALSLGVSAWFTRRALR